MCPLGDPFDEANLDPDISGYRANWTFSVLVERGFLGENSSEKACVRPSTRILYHQGLVTIDEPSTD